MISWGILIGTLGYTGFLQEGTLECSQTAVRVWCPWSFAHSKSNFLFIIINLRSGEWWSFLSNWSNPRMGCCQGKSSLGWSASKNERKNDLRNSSWDSWPGVYRWFQRSFRIYWPKYHGLRTTHWNEYSCPNFTDLLLSLANDERQTRNKIMVPKMCEIFTVLVKLQVLNTVIKT